MEKSKSTNNSSSSSSAHKIAFNPVKVQQEDDGYSSSESDSGSQDEGIDNPQIDIQKFLPPANPLQPKVFSEDFSIFTATGSKFEILPDFNKNQNYNFMEPSTKPVQLQEYMAKCSVNPNNPEENKQATETASAEAAAATANLPGRLRLLIDYHKLNKDKLVYKKYDDLDLNEPAQINGVIYFATYISHLKNLMKPKKEDEGQIVVTSSSKAIESKALSKSRKPSQHEEGKQPTDTTQSQQQQQPQIQFSSNFESGNLFCAYQIGEAEYDLVLQNDINTKGNTQWFFFSIKNAKPRSVIKFNILNCIKSGSLFNDGLCPCVYSVKQNEIDGQEWIRDGFNVKYFKGNIQRDGNKGKPHYTLTFSYYVQNYGDTIYFAHSYPYTFSYMKEYLNSLMKNTENHNMLSVKRLCKTIAGNNCDQLTITSSSMNRRNHRKGVVIFARQHPGETGGSYMMQGCIDFLLGDSVEAQYLREACVFKIVPMMNPDGVVQGNYRCSLAGCDLNRRWKKPRKKLHPTVFALKEMIKNFSREREIKLVVDLHGHSRKMNTFFYGCSYREDPVQARVFPFMMSKLTDSICFEDCRFVVQKSKEKTARIALWKELRINNVFTMEASFFGKQKNTAKSHYNITDLLDIGKNLLLNLHNLMVEEEDERAATLGLSKRIPLSQTKQILMEQLKQADFKEAKSESDGSDSNPSEDELPDEQMIKLLPKSALTKRQKQLLALEEERAKERREKELKAKLLAKKAELLQGNNSDAQQQEKRRFTISKVFPRKFLLEKKPEPAKPTDNKPNMVDASVQTDASFIMEMKAYLLKRQSLQNGFGNSNPMNSNSSQLNNYPSIQKSASQNLSIANKAQQKYIMEQSAIMQGKTQASVSVLGNSAQRKENPLSVSASMNSQQQQLIQNHLKKFPQGAPGQIQNSNPSRNMMSITYGSKQIENQNTGYQEFVSGGSTLRNQVDPRTLQTQNLKDQISPKVVLQDENIRSKFNSNPRANITGINGAESVDQSRISNFQSVGIAKNRDDVDSANTRTPLMQNRPLSIESGVKSSVKVTKTPLITQGATQNASQVVGNLPSIAAPAQKIGQSASNSQLAQSLSNSTSPKADLNIFKKSKSQAISIVRTTKTMLPNQTNNDPTQIRRNKPYN